MLLWEAAFGFSEYLLKIHSTHLPISRWVIYEHLPTPCWVFSIFWSKTSWPSCPNLFIHPILSQWHFLFSWMKKKSLQWKTFFWCGRGKTKMAETLKGIKINKFKNCFEQWKKVLIVVLHQMEITLKVTEVKHVRINTELSPLL